MAQDPPKATPVHLLSVREREVLDLAVDGHTDEQIAQALGISVSTVSSYWVRIRGKLGPMSRTELVSRVLRHESGQRYADLVAEVERLRSSERSAHESDAQSRTDARAMRGLDWHLLALDHHPEATLVCRPPHNVVYANLMAQRLFAAEAGELEAMAMWELAVPELRQAHREVTADFFEEAAPPRIVLGLEAPHYAMRRDATNFRAVLVAERFVGPQGPMTTVTVREFMGDAEAVIRSLRRPYEAR